jgi:4-hydroxy-tetrahydrodipicolinate reductase
MKIALFGAGGRMGRAIAARAIEAGDLQIVGAVDRHDGPAIGRDVGELAGVGHLGVEVSADLGSALLGADVVIDFSSAGAFDAMLRAAMNAEVAVVSGTTRLSDASQALIDRAAKSIPVLWAPNMSVGVAVLGDLVGRAVRALGGGYDVEIVEAHHRLKIDAPSGTATALARIAEEARPGLSRVHGREGEPGARKPGELGMHAVRGGSVIGDHTVHLIGDHDRIEITHRAMSRELFADGALRAARFAAGRAPGRYTLADVLAQ